MSNHERKGPQNASGDAGLEHAWRQVSDESPSPSLDAAIVAAARKAVAEPADAKTLVHGRFGSRVWLARWQPIAAAAAVAGLALILVQSMPRERNAGVPVPTESMHADVAAAQNPVDSAPAPQAADAPAPQAAGASADSAVAASVPSSDLTRDNTSTGPATAAPPSRESEPAAAVPSSSAARSAEPGFSAIPTDASTSSEALPTSAAPAPEYQDQVARIVALHAAGDMPRAAAALREFRDTVEDADRYLPASLRAWAGSVGQVPPPE